MNNNEDLSPVLISKLYNTIPNYLFEKFHFYFTLVFKRIFDIIFSVFGIILMIPLTIIVFFLNCIFKENGKIFYSQIRIGKNGKHFKMYKYRTMVENADDILDNLLNNNPNLKEEFLKNRKIQKDPRITKTGKILRRTSLDEFPQFINVLKGEMSFVGPRAVVDRRNRKIWK